MADSTLAIKAFAIVVTVAFVSSMILLNDVNNRYLDLSGRYQSQSQEVAQLQYTNTILEEKLRTLNATLISTQKTPLVEASLNQLLTSDNHANTTGRWMWILDSSDVNNVDIPYSMLGIDIRLVSEDDVTSMALKSNGTRVYSLDEVSLTDSTHGFIKVSEYDVLSVGGVPSTYGVVSITYYLERNAGDWIIYGSFISFGDYFRAIPLFDS